MAQPLVSIIIPVYNAEKHLNRCVESVVNQTYKHLEIILVDDGSTDGSPKMCDEWAEKDSRIKVVHQDNRGAGMARNEGLNAAHGDKLLFVDSDDYIDTDTINKCVAEQQKSKTDIVLFGRCNVLSCGAQKKLPVVCEKHIFYGDEVLNVILTGLFTYEHGLGISAWGKLFDLKMIQTNNIKFPSERVMMSEDAHFILQVFAHISSVAIIPENFYYYYQSDNSLSRNFDLDRQKLNDAFLRECSDLCIKKSYPETVLTCIKVRYLMYSIYAMKQVMKAGIKKTETRKILRGFFNNKTLFSSITDDALEKMDILARVFWKAFRRRNFTFSYFLLWCKVYL